MCSPVPFVDCLDEIQINSLVTLKEHRGDYKNHNSPIYVMFFFFFYIYKYDLHVKHK